MQHLSFREELHAIEAVIAGQALAFSAMGWWHELASGKLVKAFLHGAARVFLLCGSRFGRPHPREKTFQTFRLVEIFGDNRRLQ